MIKAALFLLLLAAPLAAQNPVTPDTTRRDTVHTRPQHPDSIRPVAPITPGGAFLRSLVLPGWGQARLQRNVTAGVFIAFEGIAVTMVWKASWQLDYARSRDKYVKSHTQERQDWLALLIFNHLISAAEAYVSSHLYDFPEGLKLQPLPGGRTGVGLSVPF
ncbi:MAG: hypothetical protein ACHQU1_03120 [Gemmatimonadales bacterium]